MVYPNLKLKQPMISAWLKEEAKWREQWEDSQHVPGALDAKRAHQMEHPQISDMMDLWVLQARECSHRCCAPFEMGKICRTCWCSP